VLRAMRIVGRQETRHAIQFMEQLLEPELVHLVDHDEENLVVLRAGRSRLL
jgi:hypothetical protein